MNPIISTFRPVKLTIVSLTIIILSCLIVDSNCQFHGETLKFKLSARNLPNSDLDSPSDPYVMFFTATRRANDRHRHWQYMGLTSTKTNTNNPTWDEIFQHQYINGTDQLWRFFVKDQDDSWLNPIDDPIGRVEIRVEDYILEMRKHKSSGNGTGPLKAIQMFLTHPIGGVLYVTPITDDDNNNEQTTQTAASSTSLYK